MSKVCESCNRPISVRANRGNNDHVVYFTGNRISVVEMSDELEDERNHIIDILKSLAETGEVPAATDTIKQLSKFKGVVGDESNKTIEVGECGFDIILDSVQDMIGSESGILPRDTVYHVKKRSTVNKDAINHLIVVSREPGLIDFNYRDSFRTNQLTPVIRYKLSVPFTNFCCIVQEITGKSGTTFKLIYNHCHLFLTNKPIYDLSTPIYRFPCHNQSALGELCLGSIKTTDDPGPFPRYVNIKFAQILDTVFNTDMATPQDNVPDFLGGNYSEWQKKSLLDNFIGMSKEIKWQPHGVEVKTLKNLVDQQKSYMNQL